MKMSLLILAALAFLTSCLTSLAQPANAETGYPLTCRSGNMAWTYQQGSFLVSIHKSVGPASSGLKNGQCAWTNRAINQKEINLCFSATITAMNGGLGSGQFFAMNTSQSYLDWFFVNPGKIYVFMAHLSGPCLHVDHYGP